ncbi:MAG: hypothetical protein ACKN9T_01360 [Candidatus Methylumidiphilus sp.]
MTAQEALTLAKQVGFDPALQQAIIKSNDPEWAYRFAHDIAEADLDALEPVVLQSDHPRVVYDFALLKGERGGAVGELEEFIIQAGDPGLMILFAADIHGADIERFADVLQRHGNPKYFQLFEAEMKQRGIEV